MNRILSNDAEPVEYHYRVEQRGPIGPSGDGTPEMGPWEAVETFEPRYERDPQEKAFDRRDDLQREAATASVTLKSDDPADVEKALATFRRRKAMQYRVTRARIDWLPFDEAERWA